MPEFLPGKPLVVLRSAVKPEWIDYNGHMNVAYYVLAFDLATDALFDMMGMDAAYRERAKFSTFALEAHVVYKREVGPGDPLRFEVQLLDFDGRFFHYMCRMYHDVENFFSASAEWISCGMDMATRRPAPMPPEIRARFQALFEAQQGMPRPAEAGRIIGIKRKAETSAKA